MPPGFARVCVASNWNTSDTWHELNGDNDWLEAANGAYIYFNKSDRHWWMDATGGEGIYKAAGVAHAPPAVGWHPVSVRKDPATHPPPMHVEIIRALDETAPGARGTLSQ